MHGLRSSLPWGKRLTLGAFVIALTACGGGGGASSGTSGGGGTSSSASSSSSSARTGGTPATSTYIISWDAVNDPAVTGYRIYFDYAPMGSGRTPSHVDVIGSTAVSLRPGDFGIFVGDTMYVAVASRGSGGVESPVSAQVSVVAD